MPFFGKGRGFHCNSRDNYKLIVPGSERNKQAKGFACSDRT